jgi:hypothetical protein
VSVLGREVKGSESVRVVLVDLGAGFYQVFGNLEMGKGSNLQIATINSSLPNPNKKKFNETRVRGAIHQLLSIILKLGILVLSLVSTLPYVVKVKNYS